MKCRLLLEVREALDKFAFSKNGQVKRDHQSFQYYHRPYGGNAVLIPVQSSQFRAATLRR